MTPTQIAAAIAVIGALLGAALAWIRWDGRRRRRAAPTVAVPDAGHASTEAIERLAIEVRGLRAELDGLRNAVLCEAQRPPPPRAEPAYTKPEPPSPSAASAPPRQPPESEARLLAALNVTPAQSALLDQRREERLAHGFLAEETEATRRVGALFVEISRIDAHPEQPAEVIRGYFDDVLRASATDATVIWAEPGGVATGARYAYVLSGGRATGGGRRIAGLVHPGIEVQGRVVLPASVVVED